MYVVGGVTAGGVTGNTYSTSLSTKQWVKRSSLNTPRYWHGCNEWDGGIIVVGGKSSNKIESYATLSSVEKYNPVSDKWSLFTPLPTRMRYMQVLVWANDIYLVDPHNGDGKPSEKVYKLRGDTWEVFTSLQIPYTRLIFPAVTLSTIQCT